MKISWVWFSNVLSSFFNSVILSSLEKEEQREKFPVSPSPALNQTKQVRDFARKKKIENEILYV